MAELQYFTLVRHGESLANANLLTSACGFFYSLSGSDPAVPLTALGHRQALHRGKRLAKQFPRSRKISRVFHTEFLRVEQTAKRIQSLLPYKVKLICDQRLNKRSYGRFWNLTRNGVEILHPQEWQRYLHEGDLHYRAPDGGENYFDMFARIDDFIASTLDELEGNAVVVTHSAAMLAFLHNLEGLSIEEVHRQYEAMELPNGHAITFCRASRNEPWRRCRV